MEKCIYIDKDGTIHVSPTCQIYSVLLSEHEIFHWDIKLTCRRCGYVTVICEDETPFYIERFLNNYVCKQCFTKDGVLYSDFKVWIECGPDQQVNQYDQDSYMSEDVYLENKIYGIGLWKQIKERKNYEAFKKEYLGRFCQG